jgi:hypothetical protein
MQATDKKMDSVVLDRMAIILSGTCMAHCLLLPIIITLFPIVQGSLLEEEHFHGLFLIFVMPTSVAALFIGCRKHKHLMTAWLGTIGLTTLVIAAFWGHDWVGLNGERIMTTIGGAILALSHWFNYKHCRSIDCPH